MNHFTKLSKLFFLSIISLSSCSKTYYIPHRHPIRGYDIDLELKDLKSVKIENKNDEIIQSSLIEFNRFKKDFVIQSQTQIIDCLLSIKNSKFLLEGSRDAKQIEYGNKTYGKYSVADIKKISEQGDIYMRGNQETSSYLLWYGKHIEANPVNYLSEPFSEDDETREKHAINAAEKMSTFSDVFIVFGIDHQKGFENKGVPVFTGTKECKDYVEKLQESYEKGSRMNANILKLRSM